MVITGECTEGEILSILQDQYKENDGGCIINDISKEDFRACLHEIYNDEIEME